MDGLLVTLDLESLTRKREEELKVIRKQVQEFRLEVLGSKESKEVFEEKVKEFEELFEEEREYTHQASVRLANTSREQRWFNELVLERALARREKYKHEMGRFGFYVNVCRGKEKMRHDRTEEAKHVPIGTVLMNMKGWNYGKRVKYKCPLHNEKSPSFVWYKDQNTFHCYGCSANGDVIDLVMALEHVDFKGALNYLIR